MVAYRYGVYSSRTYSEISRCLLKIQVRRYVLSHWPSTSMEIRIRPGHTALTRVILGQISTKT